MTNGELIELLSALPRDEKALVRVNDGARPDHPWFGRDIAVDGAVDSNGAVVISITVGGLAIG